MRAFIHDVVQLIKKYRRGSMFCLLLVVAIGIYKILPGLLMDRPVIHNTEPAVVVQKTQFNADNRTVLTGENLEHVIGIFVNGVWEPECTVVSATEGQLEIMLPSRYYSEAQDLDIQVETRINSDLTALSSKATITVLPSDYMGEPEITGINPTCLNYSEEMVQEIEIQGKNFNDESVVKIGGETYLARYESGNLYIDLPFSNWCDDYRLPIQIVQYYNGYPTPTKSEKYYLETDRFKFGESRPEILNSQIMAQYLGMLDSERYLVVISVMDEASAFMTMEVQNALYALGLRSSLFGAYNYSYLAVINGGTVLYEALGNEPLLYDGVADGNTIHAESAGFYVGNKSSIQINTVEYSPFKRGMNIVVYDKEKGTVADRICFDVFDRMKVTYCN